jgi:hypothetical protein
MKISKIVAIAGGIATLVWIGAALRPQDHPPAKNVPLAPPAQAQQTPAEPSAPVAVPVTLAQSANGSPPAGHPPATTVPDPLDAIARDLSAPDNAFFDPVYHVTGKIPDGWAMRQSARWGQKENTIWMRDPEHPAATPSAYYRMFDEPMTLSAADADTWMRGEAVAKAKLRVDNGLADYTNRPEIVSLTIGDRPALTWTADFTRNGEAWSESLTRIYSANCTMLFFLQAPAKDLPVMLPAFQGMMQRTVVP